MASKAHIFHDYSFGSAQPRPRQLYYQREDPVELPRTSVWRAGGGALATAAAMAMLVIGSAYAALHETPPPLAAETPTLPAIEHWQPDAALVQARVMNVLQGPALAIPEKAASFTATDTAQQDEASTSFQSSPESPPFDSRAPESREVIIDDAKMYPPTPGPVPYPNPTTTPPDAIAPAETGPATSTPQLDTENPYRG